MEKEKKLTLKTSAGRKWLLAIAIVVILFSGFIARAINTEFGKVKIEVVNIDARGATINAEIMYPKGTSSDDSLPCVIAVHGTGCTYGVVRHFAIELARRGFVAIAVSGYGAGLSEQPLYDEFGHGVDIGNGFRYGNTTSGLWDVLNYARSLAFVDDTRIGMMGHSMGSRIVDAVVRKDTSLLTYNDIMINVLYNTFGQTFTEEEINTDAATLAAARLNADELEYYNYLAEENRVYYDSRLKAVFPMGGRLTDMTPLATVNVGGYDVTRSYQVNVVLLNGEFDTMSKSFPTLDYTKEAWYTGAENVQIGKWYSVDDVTGTSTILGDFDNLSITKDPAFAEALDNRTARAYIQNAETHSENFFSIPTTADAITFFEQALNYSNGNITDGAVPMAATNQIWWIARIFNFTALLGMVGMMFPLLAMLWNLKSFGPKMALVAEPAAGFSKIKYWIFGAVAVIATGVAVYYGNANFMINNTPWFTLSTVYGAVLKFIIGIGILTLASLIVNTLITKKTTGKFGLAHLNANMSIANILKSIWIACILIAAGYVSLMILQYLFDEDYRLWMAIITYMKVDYWLIAIKYALVFLVPFLLIGASVNYSVRKDIPEWRDTLITVIVNSLGIWIVFLIDLISTRTSGVQFSNFFVSYQLVIFVPITIYVSRKMYSITKNIWVGAVFNSLLVAWSMTSELGAHTVYIGQNWLSIFFNV
jgi:fermentation-respiration switch protein FrsA (DUF1100 family)